jgi:hypothetical protein
VLYRGEFTKAARKIDVTEDRVPSNVYVTYINRGEFTKAARNLV